MERASSAAFYRGSFSSLVADDFLYGSTAGRPFNRVGGLHGNSRLPGDLPEAPLSEFPAGIPVTRVGGLHGSSMLPGDLIRTTLPESPYRDTGNHELRHWTRLAPELFLLTGTGRLRCIA